MEQWSIERIAMMLDCMEDRGEALERENKRGSGEPEYVSEMEFLARRRSGGA